MHNDPANCVDLWGLCSASDKKTNNLDGRRLTEAEVELFISVGGNSDLDFHNMRVFNRMPTVGEVREAGNDTGVDLSIYSDAEIADIVNSCVAMSLPGGKLYVPTINPGTTDKKTTEEIIAYVDHELKHQEQYSELGDSVAFGQLISEAQMDNPNPYKTDGYLEKEAQDLQERAEDNLGNGWQASSNGKKSKNPTKIRN